MILYPHQKRFLEENPDKALLCWEVGTGKTLAAVGWMEKRPLITFIVICPKQIKRMWQSTVPDNAFVVTKEEFKKYDGAYQGIVVDEADQGFGSRLFTKGRSAMATALYTWIKGHQDMPVLLLSATPIRNAPHTSHTLLSYIQKAPLWKVYRDIQYSLVSRPYNPRPFFESKRGWQKVSAKMITDNAFVASLSDMVKVPVQYEEVIAVKEWPVTTDLWHQAARAESGDKKLSWIRSYAKDKRKVIIVSRYLETIERYAEALDSTREVFVLTGSTKDQEKTIQAARDSFECFLIIQADLAAGYELPEFSHMVFVSLSFSVRSLTQMKGRVLRINALKSNWYTYLLGGPKDAKVYNRVVVEGQDFVL